MMSDNQQNPTVNNILELFGRIFSELNFLSINLNIAFSQSNLNDKEKTKKVLENMLINSELNSLLHKIRANFIDMIKNSDLQLPQQSNIQYSKQELDEKKIENTDKKDVIHINKTLQNTINFLNNYFESEK